MLGFFGGGVFFGFGFFCVFLNPLSIITASFPVLSMCPGTRPVSTEDKKQCLRLVC